MPGRGHIHIYICKTQTEEFKDLVPACFLFVSIVTFVLCCVCNATCRQQVVADLDGLPSISQRVYFIKDDAVILVALGHVCACSQVYVLPKLL